MCVRVHLKRLWRARADAVRSVQDQLRAKAKLISSWTQRELSRLGHAVGVNKAVYKPTSAEIYDKYVTNYGKDTAPSTY